MDMPGTGGFSSPAHRDYFLFQGLNVFSISSEGQVPVKVIARSSMVIIAGGFAVGHSISDNLTTDPRSAISQ